MKSKKNILILITIILIIILLAIFFNYKKIKMGNTIINKSDEDIIEYILGIKSYNANLEITVNSNKNENKYVVNQKVSHNISVQEVIKPENIAGVISRYDGTNLKLINNKLSLSKTYENYSYVVDNSLWLDSFINDYKNLETKQSEIKEKEIILEVKIGENNRYNVYKRLYIDKTTGKPTKLIVQDINKNTIIYILYSKIEIS